MLKLEIKLNEQKIENDGKYAPATIYGALDKLFDRYQIRKNVLPDGTLSYYGSGIPRDFGAFGACILLLKRQTWFLDYVTKWLWFNSDNGRTEDDFRIEDVLYHYTKKVSVR